MGSGKQSLLRKGGCLKGSGSGDEVSSSPSLSGSTGAEGRSSSGSKPNRTSDNELDFKVDANGLATNFALGSLGGDGGVIGGFGFSILGGMNSLSFVVFALGVSAASGISLMGDGDVERVKCILAILAWLFGSWILTLTFWVCCVSSLTVREYQAYQQL